MKIKTRLALFLTLGLCVSVSLIAQKPADLVGTWIGMGTLEGMGDNELTLVLELKEGKLAGHMTDQFESMSEAPISEIKLEEGVFSFSAVAMGSEGQEFPCVFKMKVDGDSMKGELDIPAMGMYGTWEATRQK
ncbi:MAG: hypothetical protein KAU46_07830 [Candidatus Aminicenantes bacterium]|nr:hypothetical protein [Candidatus Aminicenantes bacterium]